jgi:hypothetical protein
MLQCLNVDENREVREFLREAGYNMQNLSARFASTEAASLQIMKLALVESSLEPNRLNTLLRWFWIGTPVAETTARECLPGRILDLLLQSGMVALQNGSFTSPFRISPFSDFLVVSDHAAARTGNLRVDSVLWPNPTTQMCFHLSMQTPVARALDFGTGNGVLALTLAPHSGAVIATDLNPRAREFTVFNAALNGISNIEFREGSGFEPVRGERFDLILGNPPFFVTPTVRRVYSDNSMELDGFCRMLVREAPQYLTENGYCQLLVEWVEVKGQPWRERVGEWFADSGCDAWVMSSYMRTGLDYALIRLQEDRVELPDAEAQAALIRSWESYFESRGVQAIYGGVIVLHRRPGRNWVRMEELQTSPERPFGDFMRRIFETSDYLGSHADEELLGTRPSLPSSARMQQHFAVAPEGWKLTSIDLRLTEGLPYSFALQPPVADFMGLCDGQRTLAEIADHLAASLSVDPAVVRRESCGMVRRMADRGMIVI